MQVGCTSLAEACKNRSAHQLGAILSLSSHGSNRPSLVPLTLMVHAPSVTLDECQKQLGNLAIGRQHAHAVRLRNHGLLAVQCQWSAPMAAPGSCDLAAEVEPAALTIPAGWFILKDDPHAVPRARVRVCPSEYYLA